MLRDHASRCFSGEVFSTTGTPAEPFSFDFKHLGGHACAGGARKRRIAARTALIIGPVTATSASWNMMARAWRTTRAPILISLSWRLVSDQLVMVSGSARQRRNVAELCSHYGMTPSRNTKGVAHENGAIEGPHGHLKRAIEDALLMRGARDFEDLAAYRSFIDEVVGRINARNAKRIDAERGHLKPLPARRTTDYEEVTVRITSSGGFLLRKVFYTVPSRLIGHQLRVRIYDDRLDLFLGSSFLQSLPRARATRHGPHQHVVNYHHVIHSLRKKPMALMGLVYRDQLFPRQAFRDMFAVMLERTTERLACRMAVDLLALAHDRGCEAELAAQLEEDLRQKRPPDIAALCALFAPSTDSLPGVEVQLADLSAYDQLLGNAPIAEEAAA